MQRFTLNLAVVAAAIALSGCASSSMHRQHDEPRTATVVEWKSPDTVESKVLSGMAAGQFSVLGGVLNHLRGGGTASPASLGPAVAGLVDNARAAVNDSCAQPMVVEFHDTKSRMSILTTCDQTFAVGQKVSVVRNKDAGLDYRNFMLVRAAQ